MIAQLWNKRSGYEAAAVIEMPYVREKEHFWKIDSYGANEPPRHIFKGQR